MANHIVWTGKEGEKELTVDMHIGDTVRVHYKLIEKEKVSGKTKREVKEETRERIQIFEGIVIAIKGSGANAMFMVRKIGAGAIGIERIFPVISPWIKKIEIKKHGAVRRAKLYYLRGKVGKDATRIAEFTPAATK
ncbi:50S ribosomal protein L19 [Candidatus Gottesmanbacteria bacterium]|nr:50S ribosomal protein L19 [Candidatus Gottesmanbacteria bacterium]